MTIWQPRTSRITYHSPTVKSNHVGQQSSLQLILQSSKLWLTVISIQFTYYMASNLLVRNIHIEIFICVFWKMYMKKAIVAKPTIKTWDLWRMERFLITYTTRRHRRVIRLRKNAVKTCTLPFRFVDVTKRKWTISGVIFARRWKFHDYCCIKI